MMPICKRCGKEFQIYGNQETKLCDDCGLDDLMESSPGYPDKSLTFKDRAATPIDSIRAFCLHCMGGSSRKAVDECTAPRCPLYPYRYGKRPSGKLIQIGVEEALRIAMNRQLPCLPLPENEQSAPEPESSTS